MVNKFTYVAILTRLTYTRVKIQWQDVQQKAYEEVKHIMVHNTSLSYPYFNIKFDIDADGRHFQLGAFICQRGRPN